jgi:cytochrome c553
MKLFRSLLTTAALALPLAAVAQEKVAAAPADTPVSMCIGCHSIPGYQASFPRFTSEDRRPVRSTSSRH